MRSTTRFGAGVVSEVTNLLELHEARSILVVRGNTSYRTSGAEAALREAFAPRRATHFTGFGPSFELSEVERGLNATAGVSPDLVVAVGGGSVIDMGKLLAILSVQAGDVAALVEGSVPLEPSGIPVIAVPTTAGTGSEATHFATVFIGGRKLSVAHPSMLPTHAVIDPELTTSMPSKLTAITGMDALCQGVESLWSVGGTDESRAFARPAIAMVVDNIEIAVNRPRAEARSVMAEAAHLSGQAINISKTTACHALSYAMTSRFGVPHGLAVALTMPAILVHNAGVTAADVQDPRGVDHVRSIVYEVIRHLGCADADQAARRVATLLAEIGLATRLREVGIRTVDDRKWLAGTVNQERMSNNPRRVSQNDLLRILDHIA
jgi:alcohol dehydrogenase class IV